LLRGFPQHPVKLIKLPQRNLMIGQLLAGRYRVLQVLGAGGFGQTYITEDLHLPGQPKCVLKHLKPATDNSEVLAIARKLFQKEAETLQELGNHDRIPRLLAYFEERQEFYLVQEFVPGHTLSYELLSGQTWSAAAVQRLLGEILEILQFVHGQGVIHRDVKPDNIMRRDHDGKLVLIDFGAIKQVRNQQLSSVGTAQQTVAIGTPGYMAPEQARGNPRPNSDIYALGVIGIQALTGQNPSEIPEDDATGELQWQQYTNADRNLVALLTKMTRYHFRDRQPNAAVALQELRALESSQSAQLPTAPLPTNPVPSSTAATLVVAPAAPKTPLPPQPTQKPRLTDPRLDQKTAPKLPGWLLIPAVLLVSATGGYFVIPKLMGSSNQFESGLKTDRCRVASPTKDNVTKVREMPDRAAPVKGTLAKGEQLLYVDRREPFIQIEQSNGNKGWVFNDQIDGCSGVSLKPSPDPVPTVSNKPPAVKPKPKPSVSMPASSLPSPSETPNSAASESPTSTPSAAVSPSSPSVSPTSVAPSESSISAPPLPPSPTAETSTPSEPSASP
jgi:serine/threonine protein kinase